MHHDFQRVLQQRSIRLHAILKAVNLTMATSLQGIGERGSNPAKRGLGGWANCKGRVLLPRASSAMLEPSATSNSATEEGSDVAPISRHLKQHQQDQLQGPRDTAKSTSRISKGVKAAAGKPLSPAAREASSTQKQSIHQTQGTVSSSASTFGKGSRLASDSFSYAKSQDSSSSNSRQRVHVSSKTTNDTRVEGSSNSWSRRRGEGHVRERASSSSSSSSTPARISSSISKSKHNSNSSRGNMPWKVDSGSTEELRGSTSSSSREGNSSRDSASRGRSRVMSSNGLGGSSSNSRAGQRTDQASARGRKGKHASAKKVGSFQMKGYACKDRYVGQGAYLGAKCVFQVYGVVPSTKCVLSSG